MKLKQNSRNREFQMLNLHWLICCLYTRACVMNVIVKGYERLCNN